MNKKLAKISSASLEIKDRGILNFWIFVNYEEGGSQGVGGICLDTYCKIKQKRVGTAYGCEVIRRLLLSLNVDDFNQMKEKYIWVLGNGEGFDFQPIGIQKLSTDLGDEKPVIFDNILKEFEDEKLF